MKIIDDKGRLFGKISLIDIIVVIIVIVLGFAVYSRFFTKEQTATAISSNDTFIYELRVNGVRDLTVNSLSVGDAVYEAVSDTYLGVISNIEVMDCYQETATLYGRYVMAPVENRYDLIITVDSEGLISSGRYYASRNYEISLNMTVTFYTKYCQTSAFVWSIEG